MLKNDPPVFLIAFLYNFFLKNVIVPDKAKLMVFLPLKKLIPNRGSKSPRWGFIHTFGHAGREIVISLRLQRNLFTTLYYLLLL